MKDGLTKNGALTNCVRQFRTRVLSVAPTDTHRGLDGGTDCSVFVYESSITPAVCTTALLCTVGKLSHGRLPTRPPAWPAGRGVECVFVGKRFDAVEAHPPCA